MAKLRLSYTEYRVVKASFMSYLCKKQRHCFRNTFAVVRWSSSVQVVGCWLINQAEKKITVDKAEQIHKMTIIFTQIFQKLSFE